MSKINRMEPNSACNASLTTSKFLQLATAVSAGAVFGFVSEKAKVSSPMVIRSQMEFTQFIMLKMFLSATASSTISLTFLSAVSHFQETRKNFVSDTLRKTKPAVVLAGAAMLGAGMTLAGSCPGMVLIQVGSGITNSLFTIAGCFSGALLYGALEPYLKNAKNYAQNANLKKELWLDSVTGIRFPLLSLGFAAVLSSMVMIIEKAIPWTQEVPAMPSSNPLQSVYWNPILSGAILGMLQIPIGIVLSETIGGSSAYCTMLSWVIPKSTRNTFQYFQQFLQGMQNWWQVFYVLSAVGGAALSAIMSDSWGKEEGVGGTSAFIGGALMLFGARLASGCTSGHGISGMGMLYVPSCLAVPAMFAGGIMTAFAINSIY